MNELKSCPFCGTQVVLGMKEIPEKLQHICDGHRYDIFVLCPALICGARGPIRYTEQEAIDVWNRGVK